MAVTSTKPATSHLAIVGAHRALLDQLLDKWGLMILAQLCVEPRRFNQLRFALDGVTQKALTDALRRLERNGIIERHVLRERPRAVEYLVTPLGRTLEDPFAQLRDWTIRHLPEVESQRDAYDLRILGR